MKPFVVYTAITKGYDSLKSALPLWRSKADFVVFVEEPQIAAGWEMRPLRMQFRDPVRNAKMYKVMPHRYFPKARYSLWIDGSVQLKSKLPLARWVREYLGEHDIAVFKHRVRDCIYEEGAACLKKGHDFRRVVDRQMQRYFDEGYPVHNGLAECTVILRRHTKAVKRFNEMWYEEIEAGSRRDQLSFNYVAHKLGIEYFHLPGTIKDNAHFEWLKHNKTRPKPKRGIIPGK